LHERRGLLMRMQADLVLFLEKRDRLLLKGHSEFRVETSRRVS
jgi:hypothetical protein